MQREIQYISSLWKLFHSQKSCLVAPNHPVLQPASKPEALPPDVATVQQALFANRLYIPTCRACAQGWGFYIRWHPRWENQNTQVPLIGWAQESKLPMPFFLGICWKSSLPATLTLTPQLNRCLSNVMLVLRKSCNFLFVVNGSSFPVSSSLSLSDHLWLDKTVSRVGWAPPIHHNQWMERLQHLRESVLEFPSMSYEPHKKET